ncbi:MAG: heparinase, partial [Bacteroidia bacterium]|nr:heparinase [Bacteroidia bacterium]
MAHASLFDNIELLNLASNNAFKSLYQDERIRNMGRFIYKAQIGPDYFLNFADAPPKLAVAADLVYRFGKAIEDTSMMQFGAYYQKDSLTIDRVFVRTLFELFNHDALSKTQKRLPLPKDAWYPDIQVLMARDKEA